MKFRSVEQGLDIMAGGLAKVREAIPDDVLTKVESALSEDSPIAKQVLSVVTAAAERAEVAQETTAERVADASAAVREGAAGIVQTAKEKTTGSSQPKGSTRKVVVGGLLAAAAVGTAVVLWRRRQASVDAQLAGEAEWAQTAPPAPFVPGVADEQSPDVVDEQFAAEVDAEADQFAEEFVEAVEVPDEAGLHPHHAEPEKAEEFQPGVADEQSPDVVDEQFAREVDAEADHFAEEIVESIEEPRG